MKGQNKLSAYIFMRDKTRFFCDKKNAWHLPVNP